MCSPQSAAIHLERFDTLASHLNIRITLFDVERADKETGVGEQIVWRRTPRPAEKNALRWDNRLHMCLSATFRPSYLSSAPLPWQHSNPRTHTHPTCTHTDTHTCAHRCIKGCVELTNQRMMECLCPQGHTQRTVTTANPPAPCSQVNI